MRHAIITSFMLLAACGSSEQTTTVGGATVTSDESKGTTSITTDNGTIRTAQGDAAANVAMPDYAPLYPGATVSGVIETETNGNKYKMVTFDTTDSIDKVVDYYKGALTKGGWTVPTTFMSGDAGMLGAQKGDKEVSVAISHEADGKTNAVITLPNE